MRVIVVTMVFNESLNLPVWVRYYGAALGRENLLVVDHGSDDGSTAGLEGVRTLRIAHKGYSVLEQVALMSDLQNRLIRNYDVVIYTDCDEIIVPDPSRYAGLGDYLARFGTVEDTICRPIGLNLFQSLSREAPIVRGQPVLDQRSYCQYHSIYCKPLLTRVPVRWDAGFHDCDQTALVDPDLYLFHTRDCDYGAALDRLALTRGLRWDPAEVALGLGGHNRYGQERLREERFAWPDRLLNAAATLDFDFTREAAAMNDGFHDVRGKVARIPDRFKGLF